MRRITLAALIFLLTIIRPVCLWACWGTRPLAMGGAFSGLADDGNALYWNPAGLALAKRAVITTMHNAGERNDSNYDHYAALVVPAGGDGALGLTYVYNKDYLYTGGRPYGSRRDHYRQAGYGLRPFPDVDLALGVALKAVTSELRTDNLTDRDEWFDFDVGCLWRFGTGEGEKKLFSAGFLLQNASEAQLLKKDESNKMVRNFRPGLAFFPGENTVISCELYDAFGKTGGSGNDVSRNLRFGVEKKLSECLSLRAGLYHLNNHRMRAFTGGLGVEAPSSWPLRLALEYTVMLWDESRTYTHFLGLTYAF